MGEYLADDEVILISLSTYSPATFALKLIREIFTVDELSHCTIAGARKYDQLDPRRISWVGEAIFKHKPFPEVYSHRAWRRIRNAIDRSLRACIQRKKRREKQKKKKKSFESESRQITSTQQTGIRKPTKSWSTYIPVLSKSRVSGFLRKHEHGILERVTRKKRTKSSAVLSNSAASLRCQRRKEIFERRRKKKPRPEAIKI